MTARKPTKNRNSALVWRISADAPQGQWVDPNKSPSDTSATNLPDVSYGGWASSTFDLLSGVDVTDDPDTVPDALLDELFARKEDGPDDPDGTNSPKQDGPSSP